MQKQPLQTVIIKALEAFHHETGTKWPTIAYEIFKHYESETPEHLRSVRIAEQDDLSAYMSECARVIRRFRDGVMRLPVDLIESCIAVLPADRRGRLQQEIASRQGMLAVPMPGTAQPADPAADYEQIQKLTKEYAESLKATNDLIAHGGCIGPQDKDLAPLCLSEIDDVIARAVALKHHIQDRVGSDNVTPLGTTKAG